jgi:hypothetical protein
MGSKLMFQTTVQQFVFCLGFRASEYSLSQWFYYNIQYYIIILDIKLVNE